MTHFIVSNRNASNYISTSVAMHPCKSTRTDVHEIKSVSGDCFRSNCDFSEYHQKNHVTKYSHPYQYSHTTSPLSDFHPHDNMVTSQEWQHKVSSQRDIDFATFNKAVFRSRHQPPAMFCRYCNCPNCARVNWYPSQIAHSRQAYHPDFLHRPKYFDDHKDEYFRNPLHGYRVTQSSEVFVDDSVLDKEVEIINNNHNRVHNLYKRTNPFCDSPYYLYQNDYPYPCYESHRTYSCPYFYPFRNNSSQMRQSLKRKFSDQISDPRINSTIYVEKCISPALSDLTDCESFSDDEYNFNPRQKVSNTFDDSSIWKRKSGAKVLKLLIDDDVNDEQIKEPPPIQRNANKAQHFVWETDDRVIRTVSPRSS